MYVNKKFFILLILLNLLLLSITFFKFTENKNIEKDLNRSIPIDVKNLSLIPVKVKNSSKDGNGKWLNFEATAYCVFGITKTGVWVHRGIIAVDPRVIPLGSIVEIKAGEYSGIYTAMDTGTLIKGRIIDIYVPDFEEAIRFGRRKIKLRIIRRGWSPFDENGKMMTKVKVIQKK